MNAIAEINTILAQCTGSTKLFYNQLFGKDYNYTEGIKTRCEMADAYWLMQAIFSYRKTEEFQVWKLVKNPNNSAVLTMQEDTDEPELVRQEISFTDFPLDEIKLYAINDYCGNGGTGWDHVVLMLPTEY